MFDFYSFNYCAFDAKGGMDVYLLCSPELIHLVQLSVMRMEVFLPVCQGWELSLMRMEELLLYFAMLAEIMYN